MNTKSKSVRLLLFLALTAPLAAHENEEQKLLASDGAAGDMFGRASSIYHESLVVGAPNADAPDADSGAAYVFVLDDLSGLWGEEQKLVASDGAAGDLFGSSVGIYEDLAVVGAYGKAEGGVGRGAAYVFVRNAGVWTEETKLVAPVQTDGDGFGYSVTIYEETVVVSSPQNQNGATGNGRAYVFERNGGSWDLQAELSADDGASLDVFGSSVSLGKDRLAVGAFGGDGVVPGSGAAYVFIRIGSGWRQENKLFASDGIPAQFFGVSVSLWENFLAVGASGDDDNGLGTGAVYVYQQAGTGYVRKGKFIGFSAGDRFGGSVGYNYRSMVAGSRLDDDEGPNTGSLQRYASRGESGFIYEIFVASDAEESDFLGSSSAVFECWAAAGAVGDDDNGLEAGAIYLYATISAQAKVENGSGVNPLCTTSTQLPDIGEDWIIQVDATSFPTAMFTQVYIFEDVRSTPLLTSFGELLLDTDSTFVTSILGIGGGMNDHTITIPNNMWLAGLEFAVQGLVRNASFGVIGLCNAERVIIGCHHHHT